MFIVVDMTHGVTHDEGKQNTADKRLEVTYCAERSDATSSTYREMARRRLQRRQVVVNTQGQFKSLKWGQTGGERGPDVRLNLDEFCFY